VFFFGSRPPPTSPEKGHDVNIEHRTSNAEHRTRTEWGGVGLFLLLLVVFVVLGCCGCMGGNRAVPGNHIKGFIAGQPFEIENPKNTTMTGVLLSHTAGTNTFFLSIEKISSTNDPQVIDKAYAGQAHVMQVQWQGVNDTLKQIKEIGQRAAEGMATGGVSELTQSREASKISDTLTRRDEANVIRDPRTGAAAAMPTGREGPPVSVGNGTEGTEGTNVVAALRKALGAN
jgi:hypothetical protein